MQLNLRTNKMKKLILLILLVTAYVFPQADSTMQEIQGKATLADTDVLIVSDADTVYWKITYAQFKTLLGALYQAKDTDLDAPVLFIDSVYRSGSDIIFVQRDGSTFTIRDSTAAAGSGISNIVEDTTPQLGGNLDIQTYSIESVDATEFSYVDGVTSDIQTQFNNLPATWQGDISDSLNAHLVLGTANNQWMHYDVGNGWVALSNSAALDSMGIGLIIGQTVAGSNGDAVVLTGANTWSQADADTLANSSSMIGIRVSASIVRVSGVYTTSGLTAGSVYYLSTTAGGITATAPTTPTDIVRIIGYALSTTQLYVDADKTWIVNN